MKKISIKREQSQAGLSFAERENRRSLAGGESKFRPQVKNKLLLLLVLLVAVATGAWAQTETLLTTITPTTEITYSETTAGVVTVTPSGQASYNPTYGWLWDGSGSVTVEAKEGYTITKCVFKQNAKTPVTISTSPFAITFAFGKCEQMEDDMDGVTSIEVYGPAPAPTGYSITLDEGTGSKDSQNWEITPKSSELSGKEAVTVKYNGSREVKSVTVVKKAAAPAVNPNAYMKWDADQKKLVATPMPATYNTVENANDFVDWSAGTYVVEGQVTINGTIRLKGNVDLIIKDGAKLTVNSYINGDFNNLSIYGQAQKTGQLVVLCSDFQAITDLSTLEVHSAEVTAIASGNDKRGGISIDKFNVYGGLVDAKSIAADGGYGISLSGGGSMDIWGGEVKAEGKKDGDWDCGIVCGSMTNKATITVHGGTLWAGNADKKAFNFVTLNIDKSSFSGKIETSADNSAWTEYTSPETPTTKYVRVGY